MCTINNWRQRQYSPPSVIYDGVNRRVLNYMQKFLQLQIRLVKLHQFIGPEVFFLSHKNQIWNDYQQPKHKQDETKNRTTHLFQWNKIDVHRR
uniref:Phenylalanyl-tRNA synthetase beta chain n=1 Tax=Rhizophora mucronata TaxID=61149 RepID=A0A2P2MTP7_RHIMU